MIPAALRDRMPRLDQIALGLARESLLERNSDIFLWRERLEYRYALMKMRHGLESARVALAKALRRIESMGR
jgi:hypothetical protein